MDVGAVVVLLDPYAAVVHPKRYHPSLEQVGVKSDVEGSVIPAPPLASALDSTSGLPVPVLNETVRAGLGVYVTVYLSQ